MDIVMCVPGLLTIAHMKSNQSWKKSLLFCNLIILHLLKVPLSLGIRISSLCGTIRVCMKPPPSDQIWFGFTSMPDIQFNLESFVGDHKITNGRLALFLISRFKVRSPLPIYYLYHRHSFAYLYAT